MFFCSLTMLLSFRKQLEKRLEGAAKPGKSSPAGTSKPAVKSDGERWKDSYFEKNPSADRNKDGVLTWQEYHRHKDSK